jgi:recombination protein RecT
MEEKTTEIQKLPTQKEKVRNLVVSQKAAFEVVNSNLDFNREAQFALQLLYNSEALQKCEPDSIANAVKNVALTGITLNPSLKLAYLVPRKGKCTLDISYMGLIEIAINSGVVTGMTAEVVHENDFFDFQLGTEKFIKHRPALFERGNMICAYAIATIAKSNNKEFLIMTKDQILKIRKASEASGSAYSPWNTWEESMWKKTVIRQLFKYLKKSFNDQLANVLHVIEENEMIDIGKEKNDPNQIFEIS